jgi:broad specificity polyphosphatase/5'/3'-nucleotidase SurE
MLVVFNDFSNTNDMALTAEMFDDYLCAKNARFHKREFPRALIYNINAPNLSFNDIRAARYNIRTVVRPFTTIIDTTKMRARL